MNIWSSEIKELNQIYQSVKGLFPQLEKELGKLVTTDDENMLLVYSRRCLEVIITDLCEHELKRHRGTEPLQRIIDKLNKEEIVPHNIIVSMQSVNSMSTFGAHPKEFEVKQVKPVLSNLETIISWYIKYRDETIDDAVTQKSSKQDTPFQKNKKSRNKLLFFTSVILSIVIVVSLLIIFDVIKFDKQEQTRLIESLVILPIENLTGDDSFDNVAAGMHSVLISDMQERIGGLYVTNKTSSKAFKNKEIPISEIASELGVEAVIEAELMRYGDSIEMQFKLISIYPSEEQRWVNRYKEDKSKLFNLYSRVSKNIVDDLKIQLSSEEENLLAESRIINPKALDAYLMGRHFLEQFTEESLLKAIEYFNLAIEIDSEWADPYAGLVEAGAFQKQRGFVSPSEALSIVDKYLPVALKLNPNSAKSHYVSAIITVWTEWDWEKGEKEFLKALELNPNDALCRAYYAHFLMIMKRRNEALAQVNLAIKLDPMRPMVLTLCATVLRVFSEYESAFTQLEKALSIEPEHPLAKNSLRVAYRHIGDYEKWFDLWKNGVQLDDKEIASVEKVFREQGYMASLEEMIKIGENGGQVGLSSLYLRVGNNEKAMDYFEKGYEMHSPSAPYLSIYNIKNKSLNDNARFVELMKKMKLPLE